MSSTTRPRVFVDLVDDVTVVAFADMDLTDDRAVRQVAAELDLIGSLALFKVVVDFREVRLIASALLGELLRFSRRVGSAGGRIKLCGLAPDMMEIFHITGFVRRFEIYEDPWHAAASF